VSTSRGGPLSGAADPRGSLLFGTTSYVIPADLLPNVRLLAPFVDDIELVLFEGEASNLPSRAQVREIGSIGSDGDCGFTVHLPLDVGIGQDGHDARLSAQDTVLRVIDLTLQLGPHAFVVHPELPLRYHPAFGDDPQPLDTLHPDVHRAWLEHLGESLGRFVSETGPFPLAVENLQFPYSWVRPLLDEYDLGVTFDIGHLLASNAHHSDAPDADTLIDRHLEAFGDRLTVVHLHGVDGGRDHRAIDCFEAEDLKRILDRLAGVATDRPAYRMDGAGPPAVVVSLEVFGWEPTVSSLRTLAGLLGESRGGGGGGGRPPPPRAGGGAPGAPPPDAVMQELPRWGPTTDDPTR
jgi:hypothetical protein